MKEARRQKGRSQKTEVRRQKSGDRSRARGRYSDFRGRPTSSAVAAPSVPGAGLFPTLAPSQQHSWRQRRTVSHIARVNVQSHDGSSLVDALGESSLSGAVPCAGQGTLAKSVNQAGAIVGLYVDTSNVAHGSPLTP